MQACIQSNSAAFTITGTAGNSTTDSATANFNSGTQGGTSIVVAYGALVAGAGTTGHTPVVTDNQGNVYTHICNIDAAQFSPAIGFFIAKNAAPGTVAITLTYTETCAATDQNAVVLFSIAEIPKGNPTVTFGDLQINATPANLDVTVVDSAAANVTSGFGNAVFQQSAAVIDCYTFSGSDMLMAAICGPGHGVPIPVIPTVSPAGYVDYQVQVQQAAPGDTPASFAFFAPIPLTISCGNPPGGTIGTPYTHTIPATEGTPPYTFAITAGALPDGLTLAGSTGVISGTPTTAGGFWFTVRVTDDDGTQTSVTCAIGICGGGASGNVAF